MTAPFLATPLPPGTASLWNSLACRILPATLTLDNGQANPPTVRVLSTMADEGFASKAVRTLYVNLNGLWRVEFGNLDLLALRPELNDWLQADPANRFALLPDALIRAILERLFLPVLDNISRYTGFPAVFVGTPRAAARPRFMEHLNLVLRVEGECPFSTPLRIAWQDRATLLPLLERMETLPLRKIDLSPLRHANVTAALLIGSMRLSQEELFSLNRGDVLLPPSLTPLEPRLRLSKDCFLVCTLNGDTLTLRASETSRCVTQGEERMSENAAENTVAPEAASVQPAVSLVNEGNLEKLELDISFELPALRLSLAECSRLAPGYTFTLSADAAHLPVTVRAGGRAVAVGRLVDVGGTVGVQLTQVSDMPAATGGPVEGDN